jgi:hypothetical protein
MNTSIPAAARTLNAAEIFHNMFKNSAFLWLTVAEGIVDI